ncbi:hypothetical protein BGZ61DRAFT_531137 [Ilyonectria robusta]|uniref:uncharacterized protein n=1 Tax=Ilyonectria robusta TaxID=1079257 RepID=UPI001E8E4A7B|nr:uncharacterized protein BGZ61DRAFT_531137 [Ilyonectria robusta]KAH8714527.1 hypothetical protein BGZ61DRAFT_531137 [Ilyonectria robusta]
MASELENSDDVQSLSPHASHNDSGTSQNPIAISDDDNDVVFVRRKRSRTQPRNQDPIVISDDDDVVFMRQKRLRTPPVMHEPIKYEPVKHEHEPVKHEPVKCEPIKHESIKKGDLSDEDLTIVAPLAPLAHRIPRRTTRTKRKYYDDEQLGLVQPRSNSVAPPFAERNSDGDDEFNITPSTLPVPSSSLPRRSLPGSISGPIAPPKTKWEYNSNSEGNADSDGEFNITPSTLPVPTWLPWIWR